MVDGLTPAVMAGLAVGIGLVITFGLISHSPEFTSALSGQYTRNQETVIQIALANDTVQELFDGKEMETGVARPTGGNDFSWLLILQEKGDDRKHIVAGVDQLNQRILSITPSIGWLSAYPDSLYLVPDRGYQVEVSFKEPISKTEFSEITSIHDMQIEYYEYVATKNITGGASTEVFPDITQLENDLDTRHEAELIGIHKIIARANSDDLSSFIESNRDNIFEINFTAVLGRLP